jgi:hypothetical protein
MAAAPGPPRESCSAGVLTGEGLPGGGDAGRYTFLKKSDLLLIQIKEKPGRFASLEIESSFLSAAKSRSIPRMSVPAMDRWAVLRIPSPARSVACFLKIVLRINGLVEYGLA